MERDNFSKYWRLLGLLIGLAAGIVGVGCSTSMTNMAPARALEPGEVEVAGGGQGSFNTSLFTESIEAARAAQKTAEDLQEGERLSEEQFRQLLDGAIAWGLFSPSFTPELGVRAGVSDTPLEGIDVGVRYNGRTFKGNGKLQFWSSSNDGLAFSVDLGIAHQFSPAPGPIETITFTKWSRTDIDVMLPVGYNFGKFGSIYAAPRFIWSGISAEPTVDEGFREHLPESVQDYSPSELFGGESIMYAGANVGGRIGYEYLYLNLEVTVMGTTFNPEVLGERRDYSGIVVVPSGGLVASF